jgi:putative MATE family efflux protein
MGGAPKAAIKMGENKFDDANKILSNCFTLALIVSVILTFVFSIFGRDLLLAFGASDITIPYADSYMDVYCLGTVFVIITMGLSSFITTQGYSKIAMIYTVTGALLNIALDPLLIFTFNLGVKGAALATIISQAVTAILIIRFLLSKKSMLKISLAGMKLESQIILPCVALGLAPFIMMSTESILSICFNTSLQKYGGDLAVGSMTILTSLMSFAMMPLQGFTQGAQPIISYNYGAKNKSRVLSIFRLLLIVCLSYSLILFTSIMFFPKTFAGIFTDNKELVNFAAKMLRVYCAGIGLFGIQIACQMTFVSIGSSLSSILVAVFRKIIVLIPLIYIIPLLIKNKILGVYLAEPIADISAVIFTIILFSFKFKKSLKLIEG